MWDYSLVQAANRARIEKDVNCYDGSHVVYNTANTTINIVRASSCRSISIPLTTMDDADIGDLSSRAPEEGYLLVRIHVPELNVQKCLQFPKDQLVWDVKQQCLAALPKVASWFRELKESFNYGLFCPPINGKAGKFLDEERRLGDYPFNGPVGYLELKYKRRVYKMLNLDEKQLKALHTRTNLRRLIEYINNGQVEKITKMCSKGLDPNFHCQETGETPLTLATGIKKPGKVLIALVNGGALLDYRTRDGSTAMHRAVERNSLEAVKTLLELGASPNYKDAKGLTPLYLSVTNNSDPLLCEGLLHDHATIGAQDLQGWQEVHQACRNGLVQHLGHLLFYGADMNARNASGNTPLHVCAVNSQESCARQLLFRGCDRNALNYANQTPYQVAVIAGNLDLAEIIQNYRIEDVVPFRGPPSYNPRRRSGIYSANILSSGMCGTLTRVPSEPRLMHVLSPPSPCSSDRSSSAAPFSSASSSLSDNSSGTGSVHQHETDNASIVTEKSLGDTSDIISDSSGVGTSNSDTTTNCSFSMPGTTVVCLENYSSNLPGHLRICQGDIIEVTGATDCGLLEGTLRGPGGHSGLFPTHCVQEVRLRHGIQPPIITAASRERTTNRMVQRRDSQQKHFATAPRLKKTLPAEPRTVVLHRARKGFGFILRGAKATSPLMELQPSERCPALQYLDDVDKGGVADLAGLKKGDFLLAINNEDVSAASHEHVVDLIRKSGDLVSMTVVSLDATISTSIPNSKSAATIPSQGNQSTGTSLARQYATLPRKMTTSQSGTLGRSPAPLPPRRDPKTTLSVGRARARSMVAGLEGGSGCERDDLNEELAKSSSAESVHQQSQIGNGGQYSSGGNGTPVQPRTASIRARPTSNRITAAELEELFQRQQGGGDRHMMSSSNFQTPQSPAKTNRVYASVAEMKRSKGKANARVFFASRIPGNSELHRDFHSTPDLAHQSGIHSNGSINVRIPKSYRSQEDVNTLMLLGSAGNRPPLPPPTHPPPPPPVMGQVVKVDVSRGDYDNMTGLNSGKENPHQEENVMSSFRPATSAKLYASPEDVKTVGYRSRSLPSHSSRTVRKSQSMRTQSSLTNAVTTSSSPNKNIAAQNNNTNPYAQPFKTTRSHSSVGTMHRKKRTISNSCSAANLSSTTTGPPPIPEPDYSLSESDEAGDDESDDDTNVEKQIEKGISRINVNPPAETSGNSNTSGSSSGSGSLAHSFSVEEIQKVRTQLKSSKSYPNDFLLQQQNEGDIHCEDGDNSSSGVSSDQDVPIGPVNDVAEYNNHNRTIQTSNNNKHENKLTNRNSHSNKNSMTLPTSNKSQRMQQSGERNSISMGGGGNGMLTRHAVSLAQLPPPIEGDSDEKEEVFVPPPPEFIGGNSPGTTGNATGAAEAVVLAPPPQFSDKLTNKVRIVGAVPKTGTNGKPGGRLHSQ
ncbi:SH3 and multiple ankyrin repeat domains protein 3 isoform X3 [Chrysoperla carnea]|uniref:SH3 and multiple ankyrin repeat domains protein 3 isoform X3 n=1 Tax=Chrysoperla carnea TaxID=189513 RepID=UPI001D09035F|nr:SH3 and multiple ankyrin repeat domains protein 3 isoform X3 [Chrysoperla carnea]